MAPPPRYIVTRKLVKRFFENYLPPAPLKAEEEAGRLFDCWENHGFDNPKCKDLEILFDHVISKIKAYRAHLQTLQLRKSVTQALIRPTYHREVQGRFRDIYQVKERPIIYGFNPNFMNPEKVQKINEQLRCTHFQGAEILQIDFSSNAYISASAFMLVID